MVNLLSSSLDMFESIAMKKKKNKSMDYSVLWLSFQCPVSIFFSFVVFAMMHSSSHHVNEKSMRCMICTYLNIFTNQINALSVTIHTKFQFPPNNICVCYSGCGKTEIIQVNIVSNRPKHFLYSVEETKRRNKSTVELKRTINIVSLFLKTSSSRFYFCNVWVYWMIQHFGYSINSIKHCLWKKKSVVGNIPYNMMQFGIQYLIHFFKVKFYTRSRCSMWFSLFKKVK